MKSRVRHLIRYPAMFVEGCLVENDERFGDWYLHAYIYIYIYIYIAKYAYIYIYAHPLLCVHDLVYIVVYISFLIDSLWMA